MFYKVDRPLTEQQKKAVEKQKKLVSWLRSQENLPKKLKLDVCTTLNDLGKVLDTHEKGMQNSAPLSVIWRNYYMRLYQIKKLIENGLEKISD